MKLSNVKTLVLLLSFTFLVSANSYAKDSGEFKGKFKEKRERMKEKRQEMHKQLGLTEEQESKLKANRESRHSKMESTRNEIKAKKKAIADELQKEDFDKDKIKQLQEELKAVKAKAEDDRLDGIIEVRQILTPEQFQKFNELKETGFKDHPLKDGDK